MSRGFFYGKIRNKACKTYIVSAGLESKQHPTFEEDQNGSKGAAKGAAHIREYTVFCALKAKFEQPKIAFI